MDGHHSGHGDAMSMLARAATLRACLSPGDGISQKLMSCVDQESMGFNQSATIHQENGTMESAFSRCCVRRAMAIVTLPDA
jgi:hypothetical protein